MTQSAKRVSPYLGAKKAEPAPLPVSLGASCGPRPGSSAAGTQAGLPPTGPIARATPPKMKPPRITTEKVTRPASKDAAELAEHDQRRVLGAAFQPVQAGAADREPTRFAEYRRAIIEKGASAGETIAQAPEAPLRKAEQRGGGGGRRGCHPRPAADANPPQQNVPSRP